MRIRTLAFAIMASMSASAALASTSIIPAASGSVFVLDICKDSQTGNLRQCMYLMDPATALPFSPFQAGQSIGNTSFGISGTLPAFAATPTVNIGTGGILGFSIGGAFSGSNGVAIGGLYLGNWYPLAFDAASGNPLIDPVFQASNQNIISTAAALSPAVNTPVGAAAASNALLTLPVFRKDQTGNYHGPLSQFLVTAILTAATTPTLTIYVYDKVPTVACTTGTVYVPSTADIQHLAVPPFNITLVPATGGSATTTVTNNYPLGDIEAFNEDTTPGPNVYVCIVVSGPTTFTFASVSSFSSRLMVKQD